jgi:hypothetical protein
MAEDLQGARRYTTAVATATPAIRSMRSRVPRHPLDAALDRDTRWPLCITAFAAMSILLAACAQAPPRTAGPDPSDPRAPARASVYQPVLGSYESRRPVEADQAGSAPAQ